MHNVGWALTWLLACDPQAASGVPAPTTGSDVTVEDDAMAPPVGEAKRRLEASEYEPLKPSNPDGTPTFSEDWFADHAHVWAEHLGDFIGRKDLNYLEIGVYEGRAMLWAFDKVLTDPSSRAVAIDLFDHPGLEARFKENIERAGHKTQVETRKGYSNVVLAQLGDAKFDIIYIDASHSGNDVLRDAVLAWEHLRIGGVMIFNDYTYRKHLPDQLKPKPAIDAFVSMFRDEVEVLHADQQFLLRRKKDRCPGDCTSFGPYDYHWGKSSATGWLHDRRSGEMVDLPAEDLGLIEEVLRARPPLAETLQANGIDTTALREKLGLP